MKVYNLALGDKNSIIKFIEDPTDPSSAISPDNKNGIDVPVKKLDDLDINENEFNLLKLYAVGYEKFVLLGAKETLTKTQCVHFRKYNVDVSTRYKYDYADVFKILKQLGFQLFNIREKMLAPLSNYYNLKEYSYDCIAIRNIDDFLNRTNFTLIPNQ